MTLRVLLLLQVNPPLPYPTPQERLTQKIENQLFNPIGPLSVCPLMRSMILSIGLGAQ